MRTRGTEKKMKALDPTQNENYKFSGCEQADTIDVQSVYSRVKAETENSSC